MSGLARVCRIFGRMKVGDVVWIYDYANDKPVREEEMPKGSDRWKESERAKWERQP